MWTSTVQTIGHRKFMAYFADKKYTSGSCFVSCYCIVVDDVNKQVGFHGNAPPSRKQRPLFQAALTLFQPTRCQIFLRTRQSYKKIFLITRQSSNALHMQNWELEIGYGKFTSRVNRQKCLEIH